MSEECEDGQTVLSAEALVDAIDANTYLWLDEDRTRLGVVAVDVMGKAMAAAVTALRFSETLRYEARGRTRPVDIMGGVNRALHETLEKSTFVGYCMGAVDLRSHEIQISAGGYHPPLYYRQREDRVMELDLGDLPLGVRSDTDYASTHLALESGDMLLFFSDGLIEAQDDREDEYGEARLQDLFLSTAHERLDAEAIIERLLWDVGRFSASVGQTDDITIIVLRVL